MLTLDNLLIQQGDFTLCANLSIAAQARVALIGPFGDDRLNMIGTWSVSGDAALVTPAADGPAPVDELLAAATAARGD